MDLNGRGTLLVKVKKINKHMGRENKKKERGRLSSSSGGQEGEGESAKGEIYGCHALDH